MDKFYVYKCDAPGCNEVYAVTQQPLSCPYCDSSALYDKPENDKVFTLTESEE